MSGSNTSLKFVVDLCNQLVWLGFVYLGYRAVLILAESLRRRRQLRRLAGEVRGLRPLVNNELRADVTDLRLNRTQCQYRTIKQLWEVLSRLPDKPLARLLRSMCDAIVMGRDEAVMDQVERFLNEREGRTESEQQFKDRCLQLGCLGTVLGILSGFALSDGKTPPLSDLGFALSTTAVGLVLASVIDLALTALFATAWSDLRDELEEARLQWTELWHEHIRDLPEWTPEQQELQRVTQELRQVRRVLEDYFGAFGQVLIQLPGQLGKVLSKELATFADSPIPTFAEDVGNANDAEALPRKPWSSKPNAAKSSRLNGNSGTQVRPFVSATPAVR